MAEKQNAHSSLRRHMLIGFGVAGLLVFGVGLWAVATVISGAVIAPGVLVVESSVKKVQHPTGGVVGELLVKEGEHVDKDQVLMRLDATQTKANLGIVTSSIDELLARGARLEAETIGADEIEYPDELLARKDDPVVSRLLTGETKLFELRRDARAGEKAQLRERVSQLNEEIKGLTEQAQAKRREIRLLGKELAGVRELWDKNLVQITRLTALERDEARLIGEQGQLTAAIAQAKGRIAEVELQIIQVDGQMRSEVAQELSDSRAKLSELAERKVAAEDQLKRIDIKAPKSGYVHELEVHTVGGVVSPGEPIMLIVPEADKLIVDVKVSPIDIEQVYPGQEAVLHFSAFDRTTPNIAGKVLRVGADLSKDEQSQTEYYEVRISIADEESEQLEGVELVPGMPVDVFIETRPRTVISYLIKPLQDQIARTFKEG